MSTPILLLVGPSRSGKTTVGEILVKKHNAVSIAFADPIKRFAKFLFDLSDDQVWGDKKEEIDHRYDIIDKTDRPTHALWDYNTFTTSDNWRNVFSKVILGHSFDEKIDYRFSKKCYTEMFHNSHLDIGNNINYRKHFHLWLNHFYKLCSEGGFTPRKLFQSFAEDFGRKLHKNIWSGYGINIARNLQEGGYKYDRNDGCVLDPTAPLPSLVVITDGRHFNEVQEFARWTNGKIVKIHNPDLEAVQNGIKGHRSEQDYKTIPETWFDGLLINTKDFGFNSLESKVECMFRYFFPKPVIL
jgi:hypothetical protein